MRRIFGLFAGMLVAVGAQAPAAAAQAEPIGVVVMHGKGGAPNSRYIDPFARTLESRGLLVANFRELPKNPHTKLYEPSIDHLNAPSASVDEIVRWTREVAG